MRDKIPRFLPGNGISAGLPHWPFSCGMRSPTGSLQAAPLNGRGFCCLDNIRFASTGLAILEPRFVDVVSHPVPHFALSLPMQNFANNLGSKELSSGSSTRSPDYGE